jgi:hypothetical protein
MHRQNPSSDIHVADENEDFNSPSALLEPHEAEPNRNPWRVSLEEARGKLKLAHLQSIDMSALADGLSARAAEAEFDRRLDAIRTLKAELFANGSFFEDSSSVGVAALGLTSILPWDWLRSRLTNLRRRFEHDMDAAFTHHDRVLLE